MTLLERLRERQIMPPGWSVLLSEDEFRALMAVVEAADDLLLWEPNRAGYAAALGRVREALTPLTEETPNA